MEPTVISPAELQKFRSETRGTTEKIHFNNAGSSLPPDVVVDTIIKYLQEEATQGGYETEYKYRDQLQNTYNLIARLINAAPEEVAIVENASMAWSLAFNGITFTKGDEIITSEMEYVTNLLGFLHKKSEKEIEIKVIPNDEQGNFSLAALENAITPRTRLIAITHIPSTAGGMTPIIEIGKIARKHKILYLVDACQTAGQVPIDVEAIGCDMLAVTGRKFLRGPRGTGFLYVRKAIQDQLGLTYMDGFTAKLNSMVDYTVRSDARRFELYEKNRALTLGLGAAIEYALAIGLDRIWQRVRHLAEQMRKQLAAIDGITVHDIGDQKCGIVTFSVSNMDAQSVKTALNRQHINVSVAGTVSAMIYMNKNHLSSIVRASVHYYNSEEEIIRLCEVLAAIDRSFSGA